jgi:hypothetical protein
MPKVSKVVGPLSCSSGRGRLAMTAANALDALGWYVIVLVLVNIAAVALI